MHRTAEHSVQLRIDVGSVRVGMDQAIMLGLIVNELVTNGLKHGFPQGQSGAIFLEFEPIDTDGTRASRQWRLRVGDSGMGWPSDLEDRRKGSLGLQLVDDLCLQAGGTLEIQSSATGGTLVSMVFRVVEPAALVMPV
jgi:two-component sensor histidine kinase